jgi:hypothetical protein
MQLFPVESIHLSQGLQVRQFFSIGRNCRSEATASHGASLKAGEAGEYIQSLSTLLLSSLTLPLTSKNSSHSTELVGP